MARVLRPHPLAPHHTRRLPSMSSPSCPWHLRTHRSAIDEDPAVCRHRPALCPGVCRRHPAPSHDSFAAEWGRVKIKPAFEKSAAVPSTWWRWRRRRHPSIGCGWKGSAARPTWCWGWTRCLISEAKRSGLFAPTRPGNSPLSRCPVAGRTNTFVPMTTASSPSSDGGKLQQPPKSLKELVEAPISRVICQDPRTSTPGPGADAVDGGPSMAIRHPPPGRSWPRRRSHPSPRGGPSLQHVPRWQEADVVLSYTTSPPIT